MTENIIFYSILAFLSIPIIGMTWSGRNKYLLAKKVVAFLVPVFICVLIYSSLVLIEIFDVRNIFSWLSQSTGTEARIKMLAITLYCFTLSAYLVNFVHIITSRKNA